MPELPEVETIKNELMPLKDMTYTCSSYEHHGVPVKRFLFTCSDRSQLIHVVNFIDEIICNRNSILITDASHIFKGGPTTNPHGINASCPLF